MADVLGKLESIVGSMVGDHSEGADPKMEATIWAWAEELSSVYQELRKTWVEASSEGDVPTPAQGIALARFLRPDFATGSRNAGAFVARGGAGLPDSYLHVRLNGGYEGGISKDGRVST